MADLVFTYSYFSCTLGKVVIHGEIVFKIMWSWDKTSGYVPSLGQANSLHRGRGNGNSTYLDILQPVCTIAAKFNILLYSIFSVAHRDCLYNVVLSHSFNPDKDCKNKDCRKLYRITI